MRRETQIYRGFTLTQFNHGVEVTKAPKHLQAVYETKMENVVYPHFSFARERIDSHIRKTSTAKVI